MNTVALDVINQLNEEEESKVIDYAEYLITRRKEKILKEGYDAFLSLREDALKNKLNGMTLDEINEEIRLAREDMKKRSKES